MHEFYVTLRSDAHLEEFPDNTSAAFKARLPQALNFKDEAWDVALSNLCLPDNGFTINWLLDQEEFPVRQRGAILFHQMFWKKTVVQPTGGHTATASWRQDEVFSWLNNPNYVIRNSTELVAFLLNQLIQFIALNTKTGENYFFEDGQYSISQFEWTSTGLKGKQYREEGNNGKAASVRFGVNAELAQAMGWFIKNRDGSFRLGPHLEILSQANPVPRGHEKKWQPIMKTGNSIHAEIIALSPFCTWQFKNLNEAFYRYIGYPSQSLVVYSDVAGSRVVGSDIVNALREVDYQREHWGCVTIEPHHLQYVPVQNKIVETIETTLKGTTGNTPLLGQGTTSITLHFRKRIKGSTSSGRTNSFSSCVEGGRGGAKWFSSLKQGVKDLGQAALLGAIQGIRTSKNNNNLQASAIRGLKKGLKRGMKRKATAVSRGNPKKRKQIKDIFGV